MIDLWPYNTTREARRTGDRCDMCSWWVISGDPRGPYARCDTPENIEAEALEADSGAWSDVDVKSTSGNM